MGTGMIRRRDALPLMLGDIVSPKGTTEKFCTTVVANIFEASAIRLGITLTPDQRVTARGLAGAEV